MCIYSLQVELQRHGQYYCVAWWRKEVKTCEGIVDVAVHWRMWYNASSYWVQTLPDTSAKGNLRYQLQLGCRRFS